MTKYCFLGNSHLSALRMGWTIVRPDFPGTDADFFGAANNNLTSLERVGRSLVTKDQKVLKQFEITSGGKTRIDLDEYDGFVICLGLGLSFLVTGLAGYRPYELSTNPADHIVSHAVIDATIKRSIAKGGAMVLARKIRAISDDPIVGCAVPVPTRAVLNEEGSEAWNDIEAFRAFIEPRWARTAEYFERSHQLSIVRQPEETLDRGLTAEKYSRGYIRLRDGLDSADTCDDNKHMNGEYGAIALRQVMKNLKARSELTKIKLQDPRTKAFGVARA